MSQKSEAGKLLTVRAAVILALALLIGIGAGALTYLQDHSTPTAILAGCAAWAAAVTLFNAVIDNR